MTFKRAPIKNVKPVLIDVKKPGFNYEQRFKFAKVNLSRAPKKLKIKRNGYAKFFKWGAVVILIVLVFISVLTLVNLKQVKTTVLAKSSQVIDNFVFSVSALKDLKPEEASSILKQNVNEISDLNNLLDKPQNRTFFAILGSIVPAFKEAGSFIGDVAVLNFNFIKLSEALTELQTNGFYYFQNDGSKLIQFLTDIRSFIGEIRGQIETMRNTAANLKNVSPIFENTESLISDEYLKYNSDLQNLDSFLGGLVNLVGSSEEKHVLLMFQNPAEIRPAGGFLGSYGDVTVKDGQMANLEVQDIYWPDHPMNLDLKVIPPEPLQAVTPDWAARDANWFFDFPTSARTVKYFLENSKVYQEKGVTFNAVIALNIRVMETMLGFVGPIPLDDYGLTINKDNFLVEVQREVETGRDKKPGNNPKKILGVLTPKILERLNNLTETDKRSLFEAVKNHFIKKDIMVFAEDSSLANLLNFLSIDGAVYDLPTSFWGSYLAVVNANIAGGKSDAFVKQSIEARADIDTDGRIFTDVVIQRVHEGNTQKDSWWKATNQDFIQIFTNPGSSLMSMRGNDVKKYDKPDYSKGGYVVNPDLEKIEKTKILLSGFNAWSLNEFGKTVFAAWFNTPAGKTKTLNLRYETPSIQNPPSNGKKFQFIFERQSGVKTNLKILISAPLGYVWLESNSPLFIFESDDPDSRVIIYLTLKK